YLWSHVCAGCLCRAEARRDHPGGTCGATEMSNSGARIEAFLEMMAAERGASDNTLSSYRRDLEDAASFFAAAGGGGLASASPAGVSAWIADMGQRHFAASTQARKTSALRQFFKFLYAEGIRNDDPTG